MDNWPNYIQSQEEREEFHSQNRRNDKLRSVLFITQQKKQLTQSKFINRWKINVANLKHTEILNELLEETQKRENLEEENLQTQIELREIRDEAFEYRIRLERELEMKNSRRNASKRRKKMKNQRELSRSLALEKAKMLPIECNKANEDPYMALEERVKIWDLERRMEPQSTHRNYFVAERGSSNSAA